ncbi:MAG TPA: hypothetical protein VKQ27_06985 [Acetobacteraceae bacterium]|nr:hypothetical protein [Acetobacteraceae bacterium]
MGPTLEAIAKILDFVSAKRLWLFLAGVLGSGYLLFGADLGPIVISTIRKNYNLPIVLIFVISAALFLSGGSTSALTALTNMLKPKHQRMTVSAIAHQSHWTVSNSEDGASTTNIHIAIKLFNPGPRALQIVGSRLLYPWHFGTTPSLALTIIEEMHGNKYSTEAFIHTRATRNGSTAFALKGAYGGHGPSTWVRVALYDQIGGVHRFTAGLTRPDKRA